jgi:hypothetical protein
MLVLLLSHDRQREFLAWNGQIRPVILGELYWLQVDGILLYVMSYLLMSAIWDMELSFLTPHLVPISIYLLFVVDFCQGFDYWGNLAITK